MYNFLYKIINIIFKNFLIIIKITKLIIIIIIN